VILEVWARRNQIRGLKLSYEAPFLRHFTARLQPVAHAMTARALPRSCTDYHGSNQRN
jgi:tryptophanase